ncbi:uncharacterized protein LOC128961065 [Oppia nitens]|uniref:uncharacterized protein LOC128961065 n=1 Tax=Oppia nitens TaxID=1686743 RepID=UPI0023DB23B3|nr:uncharacterized protein LOC128961065 [Oppia nitens]
MTTNRSPIKSLAADNNGQQQQQQHRGWMISPWCDSRELVTVFNSVYQSSGGDSVGVDSCESTPTATYQLVLDYDLLAFAKNKITIWLTRVRRNPATLDIAVNLMATKEIINAMIEDHRHLGTGGHQNNSNRTDDDDEEEEEETSDESTVYSLYCLSVIRFCTALSQYSHETNMKSVKRLADRYSCPQWIIDCRHNLCHSSSSQPSMDELRNASRIGLDWLREYFWLKVIDDSVVVVAGDEFYDYRNEYYYLIQEFLNKETTTATKQSKNKSTIKKQIIDGIKRHRNELIDAFVSHLICGDIVAAADNNDDDNINGQQLYLCGKKINFDTLRVPKLYLRRFSSLFAIVTENSGCLSLLLNLLVNRFINDNSDAVDQSSSVTTTSPAKQHLAMCWFVTLLKTIGATDKSTKFRRLFQSVTYQRVMSRIDWIRLLYRICKRPTRQTPEIIDLLTPIVSDVIPEEKLSKLKTLAQLFTDQSTTDIDNNNDSVGVVGNKQQFTARSVKDLTMISPVINNSNTNDNNNQEINDLQSDDYIDWWQIYLGSTIQQLSLN